MIDKVISVIIPCYNYSLYIKQCIQSVLNSDINFETLEIIVVDDASTDNSASIALDMSKNSKCDLKIVQNDTNIGLIRCRNRGIINSRGEYLFFLDADNYIQKDCLRIHYETLSNNPEITACYAPIQEFLDLSDEYLSTRSDQPFDYQKLLHGNYIDAMAMFRKEDLLEIGMYDTTMPPLGWEDYELWLRLGKLNKMVVFIEGPPLSFYRLHDRSMISQISAEKYNMLVLYLKQKHKLKFDHRNVLNVENNDVNIAKTRVTQLFYANKPKNKSNSRLSSPEKVAFDEANSIRVELIEPSKSISFKFSSAQHISSIRFDPINDYALVKIHDIKFLHLGKQLKVKFLALSNALNEEGQIYLFDNKDPQIVIDFQGETILEIDEVIIELEYLHIGIDSLPHIIEFKNNLIYNQEEKIQRYFDSKEELRRLNEDYLQSIQKQNEKFKLLQNKNSFLITELANKDEIHQAKDKKIAELKEGMKRLNQDNINSKIKIKEEKEISTNLAMSLEKKSNQATELEQHINQQQSELIDIKSSFSFRLSKIFIIPILIFRPKKFNRIIKGGLVKIINTNLLKKSSLFNKEYYLNNNPDVKESKLSAYVHFLLFGGFEGRNPGPDFDSASYLINNSDVKNSGINPLIHYLRYGKKEQRLQKDDHINTNKDPQSVIKTKKKSVFIKKIKREINSTKEIKYIKQSDMFDENYYLSTNSDVKLAGVNPIKHFFFHGWKEGRNPCKDFNTHFYLETNEDVRLSGINPLLHYIKYGRVEGRLISAIIIDENIGISKADICDTEMDGEIPEIRLAVVFHLFHIDLLDEFIYHFNNIPIKYDLYISSTNENKDVIKRLLTTKLPDVKIKVTTYDNRGRDMAPFVAILKSQLSKYDLVCKIHTKKSGHNIHLNNWRKYLLGHLLGSPAIIKRIILEFSQNKRLGLIWPIAHPYLVHLGLDNKWGAKVGLNENYNIAKSHFPELMIGSFDESIDFPNGSMFWFRPEALNLLAKKDIETTKFEVENQQIDGTLAHALERLMGIIAHKAGFVSKTVFFPEKVMNGDINKHNLNFGSKNILFVAHDLSRAGAEILLLDLIKWLKSHTSFNLFVIALNPGNDGGKLLSAYNKVAKVFMWNELCSYHSPQEAIQAIQAETNNIDLIYGNTIISANLFPLLEVFNAPYISHIHEMEKSIQNYTSKEVREKMKKYTSVYIPCSNPVRENLMVNHKVSASQLKLVNAFIHTEKELLIDHDSQRIVLNLPKNKTIIWGCGTIYWRKGTDLFIETAKQLKENGVKNFVFCWIGGNYWDQESEEWGEWKKWEDYIQQNNLSEEVIMIGEKDRPKDYFTAGDIFYLPSREDPFPLVCLEAAECGLPIVCFDEAGGMPDFVEDDSGIVVPYIDIDSAAKELGFLIMNKSVRQEKGSVARAKILKRHSDYIAVPQILNICHSVMNSQPLVSVIVPVYNHAPFLKERIDSILNQSFKDYEVIIMDDASTDNSYDIAMGYDWHPAVRVIRNDVNNGSPFMQWKKGVGLAKGSYIWIAEGDDSADPEFLKIILPEFNDSQISMAYSASNMVNEKGEIYPDHYIRTGHYNNLNFPVERWSKDYSSMGLDEIRNALAIRNTIPNVSAVVFKGDSIRNVDFKKCATFQCAGDWLAYISILQTGNVSYKAKQLNYHRIHSGSVVAQSKKQAQETIPDYYKIHRLIAQNFDISEQIFNLMTKSVVEGLRNIWPNLSEKEFVELYDVSDLKKIYENSINDLESKRFLHK